ncbi:MAG: endonuclease/exonuclease/phosphatase family protein [Actinomycetota bacterium]|nr:endonuclease/exonuclease/phosphatase family protein [Actinomycetota bacterium]
MSAVAWSATVASIVISPGLGWVLCVALGALAITGALSKTKHVGLAVAYDALPYLLVLAWVVLILAVLDGSWLLAMAAGALAMYHLSLVVPRFMPARRPRWARTAPQLRLVVSNVFTENETPEVLAAGLIAADADVMVITEWNPTFAAAFEAAGGGRSHPHRLVDPDDHSEYAVCIASKTPLGDDSAIEQIGELTLTRAVVACGNRSLQLIGIIPNAVVDPGGFSIWRSQLDTLIAHLPSLAKPIVLAGDFNTTRFRPEFRALLRAGFVDAHDSLGKGLSTSFRLSTDGVLAAPGTVIRLDHALLSTAVCALDARDLDAGGSDHLPFLLTLAVRQG